MAFPSPRRPLLALALFLAWGGLSRAPAVTVVATFDTLTRNNDANNSIGPTHQESGFTFSSSGLFYYGRRHESFAGSGALYPTSSALVTITRADGGAFNFYGGDFAERSTSSANPIGLGGTRADGSRFSTTVRLDGGAVNPQLLPVGGLTNIVSLTISGGNQLDRLVFSDLVPPGPSGATVHFDAATAGGTGSSYYENAYALTTAAPGGLTVASTMNDSQGMSVAGTGTIDLGHLGPSFSLLGFEIQSAIGLGGSFRLTLTDEGGGVHVSSPFTGGTYDQAALLELFGGQPFAEGINGAKFENTAGTGVMLDNIQAVPEPAGGAWVVSISVLALLHRKRRNSTTSP